MSKPTPGMNASSRGSLLKLPFRDGMLPYASEVIVPAQRSLLRLFVPLDMQESCTSLISPLYGGRVLIVTHVLIVNRPGCVTLHVRMIQED